MKYVTWEYSTEELEAIMTAAMHLGFGVAQECGMITLEQEQELRSKFIVAAIKNEPGFGRKIINALFKKDSLPDEFRFVSAEISTGEKHD